MNQIGKQTFSGMLREQLAGYPTEEVERSVAFYEEMIDDRVENGMTEEDAVASLGSVEEVARKIREEMPISAIVRNRVQSSYEKKKQKTGGSALPWILLAVVLFPVWFPLLMAAIAVGIGLLAAAFSIVVAVFCSVIGLIVAAGVTVAAIIMSAGTLGTAGILFRIGGMLVCLGLAILLFWAAFGIGRAIIRGLRALLRSVKRVLSGSR